MTPIGAKTDLLRLTRTAPHIGAEIHTPMRKILDNPELRGELRQALAQHLVLVLPEADPTPEEQLEFSRIFGDVHPCESYNQPHPDTNEITVFDSSGGYKADRWHSDATWRADVPIGATLCMRVCPTVGGDTMFANCYEAWDALSGGMQALLGTRRAHHEIAPGSSTDHPVAISHPVTGRTVLFVNRIFTRSIVNLPPEESEALLPFLIQHVARPEFTYRHRWAKGDLLVWDNLAAQHYALFDFDEQRVVHRVALNTLPVTAAVAA